MSLHACQIFLSMVLSVLLLNGTAASEPKSEDFGNPPVLTVVPDVLVPGRTATVFYKSDARNGQDVYLHFGFNGWNLPTSGAGSGSETIDGNLDYFVRKKMKFDAVTGQFQLLIDVPQIARALHLAFCWNVCGSGDWDNSNNKDYSRAVIFPYIGPILTWNQNTRPENGVVISFEHPVAGDGWISYWPENRADQAVRRTSSGIMKRFELTDLRPGTRYSYQVGVTPGYRSKIYSFKTLPPAAGLTAVSFLVFGDAQDNGESGQFTAVAAAMATGQQSADFIVSTGDMPWNDKPGDWWTFFDKGKDLFASKVLMPSLGNHDTPGTGSSSNHESFNYYFSHPGHQAKLSYYRFDVGPAAFFAMNSERPAELQQTGSQYLWLSRQLNARQAQQDTTLDPLWSFAYWHIPPFNAGIRHWREQFSFRPAAKLFNQSLDWHFGGHEHLFQRTKPIDFTGTAPVSKSEYGTEPGQGVGYLVVPSGGAVPEGRLVSRQLNSEARTLLMYPDVAPTVDQVPGFAGFIRVDVSGPSISLSTFGVDARGQLELIDSVQYTKPAAF